MSIIEIFGISIGLAMDAFAVSICKGISMKKMNYKKAIIIGLWFGIFQGLMPIIGYFLGKGLADIVDNYDHYIAFILLAIIGINMIREVFKKEEESTNDDTSPKIMFLLAIATSIDALAVGVTFAFMKVNMILSFSMIGLTSLILSIIGVKIGNRFGDKYKDKAQIIGGIVLILIGLKILLEGLGILNF